MLFIKNLAGQSQSPCTLHFQYMKKKKEKKNLCFTEERKSQVLKDMRVIKW